VPETSFVYLENWGVTTHPYYPVSEPCLYGVASGHPRFRDGETITSSSPIKELRGRRVITRSGTVYQLGKPDPNALTAAFAMNREFSYLVLVLCCISLQGPGMTPVRAPQAPEAGSATLVVALVASSERSMASRVPSSKPGSPKN
jgi:hypothetical protein